LAILTGDGMKKKGMERSLAHLTVRQISNEVHCLLSRYGYECF